MLPAEQPNISEQAPPPEEQAAPVADVETEVVETEVVEPEVVASEPLDEDAIAALTARAGMADEYLDLAQRRQADFENFRKRMTRDVQAAEARGTSRLAKELLPALDNLERALQAVEASDADPEHHVTDGFRLVQSELAAALNRSGIEGFVPQGEPFDPSEHEAVAQHPVAGTEAGTIVEVLQSGYRLNGAILRPARVVVAG